MKEILNVYIVPIGVLLTFIATSLNIYYTRKNLKTSKYIDTITSERIKWLSAIRTDISELVSLISITLNFYAEEIENIESQNPNENYIDDINYQYHLHYFDSLTKNSFNEAEKVSYSDITKRLYVLKLRFNPKEDIVTLDIIQHFIDFYKNEYKSTLDIEQAEGKIKELINNIQIMLKNEWDKVKYESTGKNTNHLKAKSN